MRTSSGKPNPWTESTRTSGKRPTLVFLTPTRRSPWQLRQQWEPRSGATLPSMISRSRHNASEGEHDAMIVGCWNCVAFAVVVVVNDDDVVVDQV